MPFFLYNIINLLLTFRKRLLVCLICLTGIHLFLSLVPRLAAVYVNRIWDDDDNDDDVIVDCQDKNNTAADNQLI
jgi:hypothetical protein